MIKTLTAYTVEIDEAEIAVAEILEQLDLDNNLLKHSAGILTCYAEFNETGVVRAVCDALPFDVVGCTTIGNATGGEIGSLMLAITVLTSDDVRFSAAVSDSLFDEVTAPVTKMYQQASKKYAERASFSFGFFPLIQHVGGDQIMRAYDIASDALPLYGATALDHTSDYRFSSTIYNGESYRNSMALLLLFGEVAPKFFMASVAKERVNLQKAIITASEGNIVKEVNGISPRRYLESLGVAEDGQIVGANVIPFMINYNDRTESIARAIFLLTPEGYAVCGGDMPEGATLSIGTLDYADVLSTTKASLELAMATGKRQGMLMFSCIARNLILGTDTLAEMEVIRDHIGDLPHQFAYAGGEICPVYTEDGKTVNRYHNDTFVACIF